jgi:hypothetical protein
MTRPVHWAVVLVVAGAIVSGCDKTPQSTKPVTSGPSSGASSAPSKQAATGSANDSADDDSKPKRRSFKPVDLGSTGSAGPVAAVDPTERMESVGAALKPLQILVGNWNGMSRKAILDAPNWAWDLKTDRKQPSLHIKSEKGQYIRDGRLTFLPATQEYEFTVTDGEGKKRIFRGAFTEEVRDVPGDDKKMQRTYKLQLTEPEADADGEQWRLVISQQENNRYILEVDRKRGSGQFIRLDTVNTQREGTSFAISDTDYGEKTCIVSQGLGTTSVSYKGKSYWVCCSGCKAAFEDEPERWIAKWEAMQKEKEKMAK